MILRRKFAGLSIAPKLWVDSLLSAVGERSVSRRRCIVRYVGGIRNENAGMSSDNEDEKTSHRKSKIS